MSTNDAAHILLINDLPGYGKVALAAMQPVLSHMGYHLYNLPTALVSNTLDYGKFDILETTDYMQRTMNIWEELNFSFNAIATGFIVSEKQATIISDYCRHQSEKGVIIFTDPIMGDVGKLYNGITDQTVSHMRELIAVADYAIPNYTEASFLADNHCDNLTTTSKEIHELINRLRTIGTKSVIITSANVDGQDCVVGYDHIADTYFNCPFTAIPIRFPGTGDIFSALLMGHVLKGIPLKKATQLAMDSVYAMISEFKDAPDTYKGLPIETCLHLIK